MADPTGKRHILAGPNRWYLRLPLQGGFPGRYLSLQGADLVGWRMVCFSPVGPSGATGACLIVHAVVDDAEYLRASHNPKRYLQEGIRYFRGQRAGACSSRASSRV